MAVADGATNSARPDEWASLLVAGWLDAEQGELSRRRFLERVVPSLGSRWAAGQESASTTWYSRAREEAGAFSTFLGLTVAWQQRAWRYRVLAVGDTNVFVVNADGHVTSAFPVRDARSFPQEPILLSTSAHANQALAHRRVVERGVLPLGGRLWLATDALGRWVLRETGSRRDPWGQITAAAASQAAFRAFVSELRASKHLDNDDTTAVLVERR